MRIKMEIEKKEKILELRRQGYTYSDISETYGFSSPNGC